MIRSAPERKDKMKRNEKEVRSKKCNGQRKMMTIACRFATGVLWYATHDTLAPPQHLTTA